MERIFSYAALLLFALVCALGPASPSRADDACAFVTTAELESAFGIPFFGGRPSLVGRDGKIYSCMYVGRGDTRFVTIIHGTLPPGSELAAWRARHKADAQRLCEQRRAPASARGATSDLFPNLAPALPGGATFEIVPDLGEQAYACSYDTYAAVGPYRIGGTITLYTAQGLNIFEISVSARKPGLLEAMAVLTRSALPRLPR